MCLPVLGRISDFSLLIQVLHTLLGEGRPDDVTRQVFHGRFIVGGDAVAAVDVESGVSPLGEHGNHFLCDLSPVQEHLEYLMLEDALQLFQLQGRGDAEHALAAVKAAIGNQDMAMGVESQEIAEGLDGDDRARDGIVIRDCSLDKDLQGFPRAAAEIGEEFPVVKEISAQDLWDAEDEMPVRHLFQDIAAEPLAEFHDTFLMAGGAKVTALAGKGQQIFMAAVFAFHAGKAVVQIATVEITIDHLLDIGPPEAVLP